MKDKISYTIEIYKTDKRTKEGERLLKKEEHVGTIDEVEKLVKTYAKKKVGSRFEIHETYVTRKNIMSGKEFQERYDTPYYCSPSSESYWSM